METETHHQVAALSRFEATKQKADRLFALKKITVNDLEELDQMEREYLAETTTLKLQALTGTQRDEFLEKIDAILKPGTKADIWECNHAAINSAVAAYILQYGRMPLKSTIAEKTGLSRHTVAKHFATYKKNPQFIAKIDEFQFMAPEVLANVVRSALKGDTRASKLYFEIVCNTKQHDSNATAGAQNNYIQINNTILSQDNLNRLSAEQLKQIENIISR